MELTLVKILVSYLLGSVSGSLVVGKARSVDIRTMGSGNAGGTNAFRTQGLAFALAAVIIDIGKAVLATGPVTNYLSEGASLSGEWLALVCGFAAVLGHCYPVFHGFKGGKGAATAVGALLITAPPLLVPMFVTWLIVLLASGYVGLATVLAGLSLVPAGLIIGVPIEMLIFCGSLALFMTFTHRSNIKRMLRGTENRFEKARVVNWFGSDRS